MTYAGWCAISTRETTVATTQLKTMGPRSSSAKLPSSTSRPKSAPPTGTLYAAARPEAVPQATSTRAWSVPSENRRARNEPQPAPNASSAPSRPSGAPSATAKMASGAKSSALRSEKSPPRAQIASRAPATPWPPMGSRRTRTTRLRTSPAPNVTTTRCSGEAAATASVSTVDAGQARAWSARSAATSATAPSPDTVPVRRIAAQ
jgi:hypothetical protein